MASHVPPASIANDPPAHETWAICRTEVPNLCYLRYTLEAYEGVCIATSLPGGEGRVRLLTSEDRRHELEQILASLAREIPLAIERWETP